MNIYKNLEKYVEEKYIKEKPTEGHIDKCQIDFFKDLLRENKWIKNIGEIGFNMGHSSLCLLDNSKDTKVYSFELGKHKYTSFGKLFIDEHFPKRHQLIIGDSQLTVPEFKNINFDLIFIDGSHSYAGCKKDIENMKKLAHKNTILIIDDIIPNKRWGKGPTKALNEFIETKQIINVKYYDNLQNKKKYTRRWIKCNFNV